MTTRKDSLRMPLIVTAICLAGGGLLAVAGLTAALVLANGMVHGAREGVFASAVFYVTAGASLLVLPFHRRVGKLLGSVALIMLATALLVAVFHPAIAAGTPGPYQAAAIALIVLLLARLGLAMRTKSKNTEH